MNKINTFQLKYARHLKSALQPLQDCPLEQQKQDGFPAFFPRKKHQRVKEVTKLKQYTNSCNKY